MICLVMRVETFHLLIYLTELKSTRMSLIVFCFFYFPTNQRNIRQNINLIGTRFPVSKCKAHAGESLKPDYQ